MDTIERQLDNFWSHIALEYNKQLKETGEEVEEEIEKELGTLLQTISHSLSEDKVKLDVEIDRITQMERQFREGVEMWQNKAEEGVRLIREKQQSLAQLVHEVSTQTSARREQMLQRQQRRSAEVSTLWYDFLNQINSSATE